MTDFSPRLSPMLVKELRQGMRTKLFSIAFILLHTFMIFCLLAALSNPGSNDSDGFFWFVIVSVLLFVQPLRGFNALSSEYQLNTMDLIQLTKLNGWRITLGKWTALNAQGMLFLSGVLPYLVIRYFLGNVNFVLDLVALGLIGLGSIFSTAITIGCSVFQNIILRGAIVVGMGIAFTVLFVVVTETILDRGGLGSDQWTAIGLLFIGCAYGCFFFLSFGASRIAPLSENHATRKRLVALLSASLCLGFLLIGADSSPVIITIALILGTACIDALTEPLPVFSRVLIPFSKNPLTRFLAFFLSPGWISGLGFFLICSLSYFGSLYFAGWIDTHDFLNKNEDVIAQLCGCNLFIFPLLIIHIFFPKHTSAHFTFAIYSGIQAGIGGITIMIAAIASAIGRWEDLIYSLIPMPSVLLVAYGETDIERPHYVILTVTTTLLCILVPLLRHRDSVKEFFLHLKPSI